MQHTELEKITFDQYQIARLSKMAQNNREELDSLVDDFTFSIYLNSIQSLDITLNNKATSDLVGVDKERIYKEGFALTRQLSDTRVLDRNIVNIRKYEQTPDKTIPFTYFQRLLINGKMTWALSHKSFVNASEYLNIIYSIRELGGLGIVIEEILGEALIKRDGWLLYAQLSVREKEVMREISEGLSSLEIADKLFISRYTVDTHRKNIFRKLGISKYAQLIRFAQAFQIIDYQ